MSMGSVANFRTPKRKQIQIVYVSRLSRAPAPASFPETYTKPLLWNSVASITIPLYDFLIMSLN